MAGAILRFDGRTAVVTGAGRGIGRGHALFLAERGAKVVVNDVGSSVDGRGVDRSAAQAVVAEIEAAGGVAIAHDGDVSMTAEAESMVASAVEQFGRIDAVINNAGIVRWNELPEVDLADLEAHFAVHVAGSFNVTRAAWPHMIAQRYGRIVMTTSSAIFGLPPLISYGAAKGGIVGLSRALARGGLEHGIAVNVLAPSGFTRMTEAGGTLAADSRRNVDIMAPELVAPMAAFLSHESCPVTGEIYAAGGGVVKRLFLGETEGFVKVGLTPEDVRDNWDAINDTEGFCIPVDTVDHAQRLRLLIEAANAPSASL